MSLLNTSTLRSHWFWFFGLLTIYTTYDYFDHILRREAQFIELPIKWLAFTLASHISLLATSYLVSKLAQNFKLPELLSSCIGVGVAVLMHVKVTGPLWDKVFWNGYLTFSNATAPVLIALTGYLIFRGIYYAINKVFHRSAD